MGKYSYSEPGNLKTKFYAHSGIFSPTLSPEEINSILGISCDEGYHTGDQRGKTIIHEKENGWMIFSQVPRKPPMEDHIKNILDRVSPITDKIRTLSERSDVSVQLGLVIYTEDRPALFFTKEQVRAICDIGASIDVDIY